MIDDVHARFEDAATAVDGAPGSGSDDLPRRLALAAREALGVLGAAISVHDGDHRVAIGTSDAMAAYAERLQFTLGSGPAVDVGRAGHLVAADDVAIRRRWSPFADELFARTPFRAIVTVPISADDPSLVTLDLYLSEGRLAALSALDLATVADLVSERLEAATNARTATLWMLGLEANRRQQVWTAIGRLTATLDLSEADALDLLRAHALTRDEDIDSVAAAINAGTDSITALTPRRED